MKFKLFEEFSSDDYRVVISVPSSKKERQEKFFDRMISGWRRVGEYRGTQTMWCSPRFTYNDAVKHREIVEMAMKDCFLQIDIGPGDWQSLCSVINTDTMKPGKDDHVKGEASPQSEIFWNLDTTSLKGKTEEDIESLLSLFPEKMAKHRGSLNTKKFGI